MGAAEGRTLGELGADRPAAVRAFADAPWANPPPDSERPAAAERFLDALREIVATVTEAAPDRATARVLVVCHNTVLRLALCRLLGVPGSGYRRLLPSPDNTACTEVRAVLSGEGVLSGALVRYNVPIS